MRYRAMRLDCLAPTIFFVFLCGLAACSAQQIREGGYTGRTEAQIFQQLGPPDETSDIAYGPDISLHEYQRGLYKALGSAEVAIKEYTWKRSNMTTVVWLRELDGIWLSIDSLEYDPRWISF